MCNNVSNRWKLNSIFENDAAAGKQIQKWMWKSLFLACQLGTIRAFVTAKRNAFESFKCIVLIGIFFTRVCNVSTLCFSHYYSIVTGVLPCLSSTAHGPNKCVLVSDIKITADY